MELLKNLCGIHATAGNETAMTNFILSYVNKNKKRWKQKPIIHQNDSLQDNIILEFGIPRTAVFAHMDSVGFTVGYNNQLIPIGSPQTSDGQVLTGKDRLGPIVCKVKCSNDNEVTYDFGRVIARGTDLIFECDFNEEPDFIQSCSIDNRLGVFNALNLAASIENGLIVFTCREEHGGGAIPLLAKYIYEKFELRQALISDITWVTSGIDHGKGVVISLRDAGIPRKSFISRILKLASESGLDYQLEVESSGSSDARELQSSPYPIDWCFIGAPESNVHSSHEKVHKHDISSMLGMYEYMVEHL